MLSFFITVQEGTEAGADQRKDGRKATTLKAESNGMNRLMCLFKGLRRRREVINLLTPAIRDSSDNV